MKRDIIFKGSMVKCRPEIVKDPGFTGLDAQKFPGNVIFKNQKENKIKVKGACYARNRQSVAITKLRTRSQDIFP